MRSYPELADVPVVIVSSVALTKMPVEQYGITRVFDKSTMLPRDLRACVEKELGNVA